MFREWLLSETKFHNNSSMTCGHCDEKLFALRITPNDKHIYRWGQLFLCGCEKSRVWTNSIRSEDELFSCFADPEKKYKRGFCNDTYCGYCHRYLQPLKNGFVYKGERTDRWGCEVCPDNQLIIVNAWSKDPEGEKSTQKLYDNYKRRQDYLRAVIQADEIEDPLDKTVFWKNFYSKQQKPG